MVHSEEGAIIMFQVQSYINKVSTMGNHSLRLQVDLEKELSPEENAKVLLFIISLVGLYSKRQKYWKKI